MDSTFMIGFIMVTIYAALGLIGALIILLGSGPLTDMIEQEVISGGSTFEAEIGCTKSEFLALMNFLGITALITAIPSVVSAVLCYLRRYRIVAVVCCAIASLLLLAGGLSPGNLLAILVGLAVTVLLYYHTEDYFID